MFNVSLAGGCKDMFHTSGASPANFTAAAGWRRQVYFDVSVAQRLFLMRTGREPTLRSSCFHASAGCRNEVTISVVIEQYSKRTHRSWHACGVHSNWENIIHIYSLGQKYIQWSYNCTTVLQCSNNAFDVHSQIDFLYESCVTTYLKDPRVCQKSSSSASRPWEISLSCAKLTPPPRNVLLPLMSVT